MQIPPANHSCVANVRAKLPLVSLLVSPAKPDNDVQLRNGLGPLSSVRPLSLATDHVSHGGPASIATM